MRVGAQIENGSGAREAPRPKGKADWALARWVAPEQKEALLSVVHIGNGSGAREASEWMTGSELRIGPGRWEVLTLGEYFPEA